MPLDQTPKLTDDQKEYLDRNWDSAEGLDGFTDRQKEELFRGEAKKKKTITDKQVDEYIGEKKKSRGEKAA